MPFVFSSNAAQKHICVVGDVMLDHYIYGTCERISPEAPVPVVDIKRETYTLGGAGNVLKNIKAFGSEGSIITLCGDDEGYKTIVGELANLAPTFYHIINDGSRRTTVKTRVLANKHQLIRLDSEDKHGLTADLEDRLLHYLGANIDKIDAVIISDYCKGVLTPKVISGVIDLCRKHRVISIVDSKLKDLTIYRGADLIKPNKKEASLATGMAIVDDLSLKKACEMIADITQCKYVVVTLSEEGLAIYNNGQFTKMATRSLDIFDVTGAGDTVVSALAFGLVNGLTIEASCDFANHAAAIVVGKVGTATATINEINNKFF
jgi:D-beta-D-heptose 7-phosphate kinase/D-beta-D-heptose 1-phosphate adenosyltransferase